MLDGSHEAEIFWELGLQGAVSHLVSGNPFSGKGRKLASKVPLWNGLISGQRCASERPRVFENSISDSKRVAYHSFMGQSLNGLMNSSD